MVTLITMNIHFTMKFSCLDCHGDHNLHTHLMWLCAITKVYKDLQSYLPFDWMEIKWIVPLMHHWKIEKKHYSSHKKVAKYFNMSHGRVFFCQFCDIKHLFNIMNIPHSTSLSLCHRPHTWRWSPPWGFI